MKNLVYIFWVSALVLAGTAGVSAQESDRRDVRRGNREFKDGNFQEAEHRLEEVLAETPECPLAWKLAFDMRLEYQHDPSGAMLVAEQYFRLPKREYAPENRQMLLVYAELAGAAGQEQAARSLIQSELKNHRRSYSAGDRRLLRQRLVVS